MAQTQRIVKVFCTQEEQAELSRTHDTIESYDSFVLRRLASKEVARVSRAFPTQDITDQFRIELGARTIDTGRPRVVSGGATRSHGAYRGVAVLSAKPHHHLIQFVGPIQGVVDPASPALGSGTPGAVQRPHLHRQGHAGRPFPHQEDGGHPHHRVLRQRRPQERAGDPCAAPAHGS